MSDPIDEIRKQLIKLESKPNLGLATTRQLLEELKVRFELHCKGGLDYRTVDGD